MDIVLRHKSENFMNKINYDEILQTIRYNLLELMNNDELSAMFEGYRIVVSNEQQYLNNAPNKDTKKTIYIVVKFGSAMTYFNQVALPLTITAMSEQNSCKICQKLLTEYAVKYSSEEFEKGIQQIYESPSVLTNFNEVYTGFRSILSMTATFVILSGINLCSITYNYTDEKGVAQHEKVKTFTSNYHLDIVMDSQATYNSRNYSKSIGKVGSLSVSGATYFFGDSQLFADIIKIMKFADESMEGTNPKPNEGVNNSFNLTITFLNTSSDISQTVTANFKLTVFSVDDNIGQVPVASFGFSK